MNNGIVGFPPASKNVGTQDILDRAVTTAKIQDQGVTTQKMALGAADHTIVAPGAAVNSAYAEYLLNADFAGTIPFDDTIPQIGEGSQILTLNYPAPKSLTNKLRCIFSTCMVTATAGGIGFAAAIFRQGVNDALSTAFAHTSNNGFITPLMVVAEFVPGTLNPLTLEVRMGSSAGTAFRLNGNAAGRIFGGVWRTTLVVTEIKA